MMGTHTHRVAAAAKKLFTLSNTKTRSPPSNTTMLFLQPGRCGLRHAILSRQGIAQERVLSVHVSCINAPVHVQAPAGEYACS